MPDGRSTPDQALRLLARVRPVQFDETHRRELASVLLSVVDNGGDESWFEHLAPKVDNPELDFELERRLEQSDRDIRRRASWAKNSILRARARHGE